MAVNVFEIWWINGIINLTLFMNGMGVGVIAAAYLFKSRNMDEKKIWPIFVIFQIMLNFFMMFLILWMAYQGIGVDENTTSLRLLSF